MWNQIRVFMILSFGVTGIAVALFGFLSGLLILFTPELGVIFLIIGALVTARADEASTFG